MSKWISVKDRLPEENITVLAYCPRTLDVPVWLGFYAEKKWYLYDADNLPITHWMPIPELPGSKTEYGE